MDQKTLLEHAFKAMENAYAPYSHFKVGACAVLKNGTYFYGANVENASYGATNCAERNAVFAAYSNGYRKDDIEAVAIVSEGHRLAAPCGVCRQVLCELLNQDTPIVLANKAGDLKVTNIEELLPMQFNGEDLA